MTALQQQGAAARTASRVLATAGTAKKNAALEAIAKAGREAKDDIIRDYAESTVAVADADRLLKISL